MESVLLDTDVFSFSFKNDTRRELYRADIEGKRLCVSFMTIAELRFWAILRNWGDRRRGRLDQVLRSHVVIPFDDAMAHAWATIMALRHRIGQRIECGDCWVAAAAVRHAIPLVTHNPKDFTGIPGLVVVTRLPGWDPSQRRV